MLRASTPSSDEAHLQPWQATRKKRLIREHPLFGEALRCEGIEQRWPGTARRARLLPARWFLAFLIMGEDGTWDKEAAMWSNTSDVFLLTYRTRREDALFCPDLVMKPDDKGAFSRGRNTLLLAVQLEELRRGWAYEYYVFSDVDVAVAIGSWSSALPGFVDFLWSWRPAVGVPLYWNEAAPFMYTHIFNKEQRIDPEQPRSIYWHDQMFVALHREAAQVLLPLDPNLDRRDAMISQWMMSSVAALLFRGHVLLYMGMELRNPKHERDADEAIQEQCENVSARLRMQVPPRLRHCVLNPWNAYGVTFSNDGFSARHLRGRVVVPLGWRRRGLRLELEYGDLENRPGESGVLWVHSYYPWGAPAHKRWDYSTATLATSPTCDDEAESRGFWWGRQCPGPRSRSMEAWLACARFNFLGAAA